MAQDGWPSPVEGAALEMPYSRKAVLGSNPNPSATVLSQDIVHVSTTHSEDAGRCTMSCHRRLGMITE